MINFKTAYCQNFQSFGNTLTEFDLTKTKTTVISGKNGSGKSTIIDIICFALFNKPFKDVNKGTVVNTIIGKKCLTGCTFSIGSDEYEVKRGLKPVVFEIWKNGEKLDKEAASKDHQKLLEENILQINYKTFTQIVIVASANFKPFMQLTAADRRSVVEDLLDIQIFSLMGKLAKEKTSNVVQKIAQIDTLISNQKSKITQFESFIEKIKNEEKVQDVEIDKKIAEIASKRESHEKTITELTKRKEELYSSISDESAVTTKKSEIWSASLKMSHARTTMVTEHQFLLKNDNCPTCKQPISEDFKENKIKVLTESIAKRDSAIKQATDVIKKYDGRLTEINKVMSNLKSIDSEISNENSLLTNGVWQITQLEKQKNKKIVSTDNEQNEVKKLNKTLISTIDDRDSLIEEKSYYDVVNVMLKDNGIKSSIVKQYIPILNKLINHYLELMDFFVKFTFDENFNDVIQLRQRDVLGYNNLSEGQKKRVDLSIIFAFRKIAESKNICNVNVLFFDDVLGALDDDGVSSLTNILDEFSDKNIFVITPNEMDGFERSIKVSMKNNYSVVTENLL